jgi:uncharacterized protein
MKELNEQLPQHIAAMLNPAVYDHDVSEIELIQTHISWVILTGPFAYKIKKPVDLDFLDFSTLEKRRFYCSEELRLNKRFAPNIYLEIIAISYSENKVRLAGPDHIVDYAIKMNQFPQNQQLDNMLNSGQLKNHHIDLFADNLVAFHQQATPAPDETAYGEAETVLQVMQDNFQQLHSLIVDPKVTYSLEQIEQWLQQQSHFIKSLFSQRKQAGFIRECHGDLHLHNLIFLNDTVVAFDCIEFSDEFRWIDIISDLAFTLMDLDYRNHHHFAQRLLNTYLQKTGDFSGLQVLTFYLIYRALVRAKVEAISAKQKNKNTFSSDFYRYLTLANHYIQKPSPALFISYGVSGSGKSTITKQLCEKITAIRLRSDIERKRLFTTVKDSSKHQLNRGLYSAEHTQATYQYLVKQAELILSSGYSVIIDAACLQYKQRSLFEQLAKRKNIPFLILEISASTSVLRQRIKKRTTGVSDADLSVLEYQLANREALLNKERPYVITINTNDSIALYPSYLGIDNSKLTK